MITKDYLQAPEGLLTELFKPGNLVHGVQGMHVADLQGLLVNGLLPYSYVKNSRNNKAPRATYTPYDVSFSMLNNKPPYTAYKKSGHYGPKYWNPKFDDFLDFGIIASPKSLTTDFYGRIEAVGSDFFNFPEDFNVENNCCYGIPLGERNSNLVHDEVVVHFPREVGSMVNGITPNHWAGLVCWNKNEAIQLHLLDTNKTLSHLPTFYFNPNDQLYLF